MCSVIFVNTFLRFCIAALIIKILTEQIENVPVEEKDDLYGYRFAIWVLSLKLMKVKYCTFLALITMDLVLLNLRISWYYL